MLRFLFGKDAYARAWKRVIDMALAIASLIILSPIFLIVPILIKLDSPGPVFFLQERVGKDFKKFKIIKFRTMVVEAPKLGNTITKKSDERITRVGKFLRKFKIDEMPQIINVLKGDMSVVGPRSDVEKYVNMFKDDFREILRVRPGMAGYVITRFRNEEEILEKYENLEEGYIKEVLPRKIALDKEYVKNISFWNDIKIFLLTFLSVVTKWY
jgi:lipopolysaccharide/colanic/teichoic acid biosynthesis glycosyltransferase